MKLDDNTRKLIEKVMFEMTHDSLGGPHASSMDKKRETMIDIMTKAIAKDKKEISDELLAAFLSGAKSRVYLFREDEYVNPRRDFEEGARPLNLRVQNAKFWEGGKDSYGAMLEYAFLNLYDKTKTQDQNEMIGILSRLSEQDMKIGVLSEFIKQNPFFLSNLLKAKIESVTNDPMKGTDPDSKGYTAANDLMDILKNPLLNYYQM